MGTNVLLWFLSRIIQNRNQELPGAEPPQDTVQVSSWKRSPCTCAISAQLQNGVGRERSFIFFLVLTTVGLELALEVLESRLEGSWRMLGILVVELHPICLPPSLSPPALIRAISPRN